jgi:hypothetical protein
MNADREDVCPIQSRLNRSVFFWTQVAHRNPHSIAINLSALVEQNLHWPLAINLKRELISNWIEIPYLTPHDRGLSGGQGRERNRIAGQFVWRCRIVWRSRFVWRTRSVRLGR